jgi:hypothetical protein
MLGQCRLCLRNPLALRDSHFLSAGIYKILRDDSDKNPNPWLLTEKSAFQTSWQMKARLLCCDCEQRLSRFGENWVLRNCLREDRSFPLAALLASKPPDLFSERTTTRVYYGAGISEIDVPALAFFATSIFWRGSIHPWNRDGSVPITLGPFQESFRQYLSGTGPFPEHCALWVAVREGNDLDRLTYAPLGERRDRVHIYKFPMPGFGFSLTVSKNIPGDFRKYCFVRGAGNPIVVTNLIEKFLEEDAVKLRQKSLYRIPA